MRRPSTRPRRRWRSTISKDRGLVVREVDPTNRRCKVVSLTEAGRAMVREIDAIDDPAPESWPHSTTPNSNAAGDPRQRLAGCGLALQHRHRRVVPADARDRATAP